MSHHVPMVSKIFKWLYIFYCPLPYVCLLFSLFILSNLIFFLNLHMGIFLLNSEATLDNTVLELKGVLTHYMYWASTFHQKTSAFRSLRLRLQT